MKHSRFLSFALAVTVILSSLPMSFFNGSVYAVEASDTEIHDNSYENTEILLSRTDVTDTSITVSWNKIQNAETYTVICNDSAAVENVTANQYNITDLQPGSEIYVYVNAYDADGILLMTSEEKIFHTSLTVNSNLTLNKNLTVDSLYINNGTLNLNGHSIIVDKNVDIISSSAKINVGSGRLHINGDLKLQNETSENGYVGGIEMTNSKGNVYVGGNIELLSRNFGTLSAGTLELCGDVINPNENSLYTTTNHKIVLSGHNTQTIDFPSSTNLNVVEVKNFSNGGIVFTNQISINSLVDNGCKVLIASE